MTALDKRQSSMIELHPPTGDGLSIVAFHAQAVQLERKRYAPQEISHEDQASVQDRQYGEFLAGIIGGDLNSQFIEARGDFRLAVKHALQVTLHRLRSLAFPG